MNLKEDDYKSCAESYLLLSGEMTELIVINSDSHHHTIYVINTQVYDRSKNDLQYD